MSFDTSCIAEMRVMYVRHMTCSRFKSLKTLYDSAVMAIFMSARAMHSNCLYPEKIGTSCWCTGNLDPLHAGVLRSNAPNGDWIITFALRHQIAIKSIAPQIGCAPDTLRAWV
jgi:hypothetical protein